MRIDPNVVVFPVATSTPEEDRPAPKTSSGEAAVVSLSAGATAATREPTAIAVDVRIQRIRELIDRGEYPVDLDTLSSRIVDDDILRGGGA